MSDYVNINFQGFIGTENNVIELVKGIDARNGTFTYQHLNSKSTGSVVADFRNPEKPSFKIEYLGNINPLTDFEKIFSPSFKEVCVKIKPDKILQAKESLNLSDYEFTYFNCDIGDITLSNHESILSSKNAQATSVVAREDNANKVENAMKKLGFVKY